MSRKTTSTAATKPLRQQIIEILSAAKEATLKQIIPKTTEALYESRVSTELNAMRTDGVIECGKKKGKNENWYWLAMPPEIAGGVVVAPASKPADATDDIQTATVLSRTIADIRTLSGVGSNVALTDLPEAIRKAMAQYCQRIANLEGEVEAMAAALNATEEREAAHDHAEATNAAQAPAPIETGDQLVAAQSQLEQVCELLCTDVDTAIDPADMDAVEMAQAAQRTIRDLRTMITATGAQLPRPEPRGYVVLGDGCVQANFESFETARAIAEEMLENASAISVAVCALQPMVSGRIERRAVWSGQ